MEWQGCITGGGGIMDIYVEFPVIAWTIVPPITPLTQSDVADL